jgi:hypothetical protein
MFNQLFRDDIDPSRFIRPVRNSTVNKKCVVCKVYFEDKRGLSYVGETEIPLSLLTASSAPASRSNRWSAPARVGFSSVSEDRREREAQEAPPRERYENRRRERDDER